MVKDPNTAAVRAAIDSAVPYEPDPAPAAVAATPAPIIATTRAEAVAEPLDTKTKRTKRSVMDGTLPGQWLPDKLGLPPECPIVPLGVDGGINWCLDTIGQLVAYQAPYGQAQTIDLFRGEFPYLEWAWPKWKQGKDGDDPTLDGWKNEKAREAIVTACTLKGPWSPVEKLRGRGAWVDIDGDIVIHSGKQLHRRSGTSPPGEVGGYVYPTRPPIPEPWPREVAATENPAGLIKLQLAGWNWKRPDVDPTLLLGWIAGAAIGGALSWRPVVYLTGDKGTGKSTLQRYVKGLLGDLLLNTTDTTAAGIYQRVKHDSVPVAVDEFEGKSDTRAAQKVLELARQACSGGIMFRGGDNHQGTEFRAMNMFLFSSINTPPLEPQDLSRMGLLQLKPLPADAKEPLINITALGVIGRTIQRRMMDQFHRLEETFAAFKAELRAANMDARGQDTFGMLLACADCMEHDGWDEVRLRTPCADGEMRPWRELLDVAKMIEFEDADANWRKCLDHLLGTPVEAWKGGTRSTIGQVLADWWEERKRAAGDLKDVKKALSQAGVSIQLISGETSTGYAEEAWLLIPNQDPLLMRLFTGSKWCGVVGAGVWAGALRQAPEHTQAVPGIYTIGQGRINGVLKKGTLVRLEALYGDAGIMEA